MYIYLSVTAEMEREVAVSMLGLAGALGISRTCAAAKIEILEEGGFIVTISDGRGQRSGCGIYGLPCVIDAKRRRLPMPHNETDVLIASSSDVMSQGFGFAPQMLFRDKRISIQAKGLYEYLASFAGADTSAFPSRERMREELGMGKNILPKYIKELDAYGYIRVTQKKRPGGSSR